MPGIQAVVTVPDVGALLHVWRAQLGFSTEELAKRASELLPGDASLSYMTITRYESCQWPKAGPDPVTLAAITRALGHDIAELPDDERKTLAVARSLMAEGAPRSKEPVLPIARGRRLAPVSKRNAAARPRSATRSRYAPASAGMPSLRAA